MATSAPSPPDQRTRHLYGTDLVRFIIGESLQIGLDPAVPLSIIPHEGGYYGAVGDNGTSYGPFQLHRGGALPPNLSDAQARGYGNSPEGIVYALRAMENAIVHNPHGNINIGKGPQGQPLIGGVEGVKSAVTYFERPQNPAAESAAAQKDYWRIAGVEGNASDWLSGGTGPYFRYPAAGVLAVLGGGLLGGTVAGRAVARGAGRTVKSTVKAGASSLEGKAGIALVFATLALVFRSWAVRVVEIVAGAVLVFLGLLIFARAATGSSAGAATRGGVGTARKLAPV